MHWTTGAAVYFIIWWLVIFMVLPWGVRTVDPDDIAKGHASSAPKRPRMLAKMAATTVIAGVLWGLVYVMIDQGWISIRP